MHLIPFADREGFRAGTRSGGSARRGSELVAAAGQLALSHLVTCREEDVGSFGGNRFEGGPGEPAVVRGVSVLFEAREDTARAAGGLGALKTEDAVLV